MGRRPVPGAAQFQLRRGDGRARRDARGSARSRRRGRSVPARQARASPPAERGRLRPPSALAGHPRPAGWTTFAGVSRVKRREKEKARATTAATVAGAAFAEAASAEATLRATCGRSSRARVFDVSSILRDFFAPSGHAWWTRRANVSRRRAGEASAPRILPRSDPRTDASAAVHRRRRRTRDDTRENLRRRVARRVRTSGGGRHASRAHAVVALTR